MSFSKYTSMGAILWLLFAVADVKAAPCPDHLQKLATRHLESQSLCDVYERYQQLQRQWRDQQNSEPRHIIALIAPRLISDADWKKAKSSGNFNPRTIYQPQPKTWDQWLTAAELVWKQAQLNRERQWISPITPGFIREIHSFALLGLSAEYGHFRKNGEVGVILNRSKGLTDEQILKLLIINNKPSSTEPGERPLIDWKTTICWDEQTPELLAKINSKISQNKPWYRSSDWPAPENNTTNFYLSLNTPHCGVISYPEPEDIETAMQSWAETLAQHTKNWFTGDFKEDPLLTIGRAQSWLVKIHPFADGNGRMSRFMMDLLVESLGLPFPLLANMDNDLYLSETEWSTEIGQGILRHLNILENCLAQPNLKQCQTLPPMQGDNP